MAEAPRPGDCICGHPKTVHGVALDRGTVPCTLCVCNNYSSPDDAAAAFERGELGEVFDAVKGIIGEFFPKQLIDDTLDALKDAAGVVFASGTDISDDEDPGDPYDPPYLNDPGYVMDEMFRLAQQAEEDRQEECCSDCCRCAEPDAMEQTCPKCGSADTSMSYVADRTGYDCSKNKCDPNAGEHFHRVCRRCHYGWGTNDVISFGDQPWEDNVQGQRGERDRIRFEDTSEEHEFLDEVVASNCHVHLERTDKNSFYLGVYGAEGNLLLQFRLAAKEAKVKASLYTADGLEGVDVSAKDPS